MVLVEIIIQEREMAMNRAQFRVESGGKPAEKKQLKPTLTEGSS